MQDLQEPDKIITNPLMRKTIHKGDNVLTVSRKQEANLGYFWYGFAIYMLFFFLASTESPFLSAASCQGFQIIGFGLMILGGLGLMQFKFDSNYLKILFILNLLYSVTIVLRGSKYDFDSLKQMFLDITFGIWPYFASVVLLLPRNIKHYKKIFFILLIFGAAFLLGVTIFYDTLHDYDRLNLVSQGLVENLSSILGLPVGYLLLNYIYHTGKKGIEAIGIKNIFAGLVMAVALFFAIFRARRGLIFVNLTTLSCVGMLYIISTKKKALIIFVAVFLAAIASLSVSNVKTPAMFNFLLDRGEEDTRSGVEDYMYADMSQADWIIGKGIKGKYYCPVVDNVNDAEGAGYRDNIETGYLQIILKGGILSLGLILLMLFPAVYKGLFKSKNVLSKAAALWIFLWIVYLYPTGGLVFNMSYVLVWISVGICYSDKIRNLSDDVIKTYIQN